MEMNSHRAGNEFKIIGCKWASDVTRIPTEICSHLWQRKSCINRSRFIVEECRNAARTEQRSQSQHPGIAFQQSTTGDSAGVDASPTPEPILFGLEGIIDHFFNQFRRGSIQSTWQQKSRRNGLSQDRSKTAIIRILHEARRGEIWQAERREFAIHRGIIAGG